MEVTKQIATAASSTGQFVHMLSGPTPVFRIVVAPNGDTRYSSAWIDLSSGPQILHVPDAGSHYFVAQVMDAWTDVIPDPTPRIANSSPANYVLVGPDWKASPGPASGWCARRRTTCGFSRARARPDDARNDHGDPAAVQHHAAEPFRRRGVRAGARHPARAELPTGPTPPSLVAAMPADVFFARLAAALGKNPPRASDAPIVERLARIGVVPGQAFDAVQLDAARRAALDDGLRDARALLDRYDAPKVAHVNGWRWTKNTGRFATDYTYRAFIAQTLLAANLPEDAVYPETSVDARGAPLTGERRYTLHFDGAQLPPRARSGRSRCTRPIIISCRMRSTAIRCATPACGATRTARSTSRSSTTRRRRPDELAPGARGPVRRHAAHVLAARGGSRRHVPHPRDPTAMTELAARHRSHRPARDVLSRVRPPWTARC